MLTVDDLINVLRRTTDPGWLDAMLADPTSDAVLRSMAAMFSRVSVAGDGYGNIGLISTAPAGRVGTYSVVAERVTGGSACVIPAGTKVRDSRGYLAVTPLDVPSPANSLTVLLPLQTVRETELVNTIDPPVGLTIQPSSFIGDASNATPVVIRTTTIHGYVTGDTVSVSGVLGNAGANGRFPVVVLSPTTFRLTGSVGTGDYAGGGVVEAAPFGFHSPVAQGPIIGSISDFLSKHGQERGTLRQAGEDDDTYRGRVRNIPDAVTPIAIIQAVQGVAQSKKLPPFTLYEPFDDGADPAVKAENALAEILGMFCDDPGAGSPTDPTGGYCDDAAFVIFGFREACDYFQIDPDTVPRDPDDSRFFCDAWSFCDDPVFGFIDVVNNPTLSAGLMAIWEEANRKRSAGVQFDIVIPAIKTLQGVGATSSGSDAIIFSLTPPAGSVWLYLRGWMCHTPDSSPRAHRVRFHFENGDIIDTAQFFGASSEAITRENVHAIEPVIGRLTQIEGIVQSDGATSTHGYGAFLVIEQKL